MPFRYCFRERDMSTMKREQTTQHLSERKSRGVESKRLRNKNKTLPLTAPCSPSVTPIAGDAGGFFFYTHCFVRIA